MRHLIIGYGEVGQALSGIFLDSDILDSKKGISLIKQYPENTVMHICFPCNDQAEFIKSVEEYKKIYKPNIVIVHSSVPIGICEKLDAVHSPVRGVHPHLEKGLRIFVKYFGGFKAHEAARLFEEQGIKTRVIRDSRTTEAAKLWDTTQYGIMILLEKEIHKFCRENGLDFEVVYAEFNQTYHEGYSKLGMSYVTRPSLMHKEGKIGGHCVVENAVLLDTPLAKLIIERNKEL
jgi:UDP-N-acetyl-D-mannosaminuronate dehydrogenase